MMNKLSEMRGINSFEIQQIQLNTKMSIKNWDSQKFKIREINRETIPIAASLVNEVGKKFLLNSPE